MHSGSIRKGVHFKYPFWGTKNYKSKLWWVYPAMRVYWVGTLDAAQNAGTVLQKRKPAARELLTAGVEGVDTLDAAQNAGTVLQKRKTCGARIAHRRCGGERWIRTIEVTDNRFTVCPLWPLGNLPIFNSTLLKDVELVDGLEPPTC